MQTIRTAPAAEGSLRAGGGVEGTLSSMTPDCIRRGPAAARTGKAPYQAQRAARILPRTAIAQPRIAVPLAVRSVCGECPVPQGTGRVAQRIDGNADAARRNGCATFTKSEEHTSELQSLRHLVCRLLL